MHDEISGKQVELEEFFRAVNNLSHARLRTIQRRYENPTIGYWSARHRYYGAGIDWRQLAKRVGIGYRYWTTLAGPEYGAGLQPIGEVVDLLTNWRSGVDQARDFIAIYQPFLEDIPLHRLGFAPDWLSLESPEAHGPLVARYEQVLTRVGGKHAARRSLLPDAPERIEAALCFCAARRPEMRPKIMDDLVDLALFVPDADADAVIDREGAADVADVQGSRAEVVLNGIGEHQAETLEWLGISSEPLARSDKRPRVGGTPAGEMKAAGEMMTVIYIASLAVAFLTCFILVLRFHVPSSWLQAGLYAGAWAVGAVSLLADARIAHLFAPAIRGGGWRSIAAKAVIWTVAVLLPAGGVAVPWLAVAHG